MRRDLRVDGSRNEYHSRTAFSALSVSNDLGFLFLFIFIVFLQTLSFGFDDEVSRAHESVLAHRRRKTVCVRACSSFTTWSRRSDMFGPSPISSIKNKLDPLDLSYREVAHIFHFFPPVVVM